MWWSGPSTGAGDPQPVITLLKQVSEHLPTSAKRRSSRESPLERVLETVPDLPGSVHSFESAGAVDGPGIRMVVFLAGCPLRCVYCHNPDTRQSCHGESMGVHEVLTRIFRVRGFLTRSGGGVTLSGGEPLRQPAFVEAILEGCRLLGLHTAIDTCGHPEAGVTDTLLTKADLVLLDIKSWDPDLYRRVTGASIEPTLRLARRLEALGVPLWVRFVLVPGLTDEPDNIEGLAGFCASLSNLEQVEVLPFHKMGEYKWKERGMTYALDNTPAATAAETEAARAIFRARGVKVR